MLQFVWNKTKRTRKGMPFCRKWAPFNLIVLALFLCMADLTRHLVNDAWGTACDSLDRDANPNSVLGFRDAAGGNWNPLGAKYNKYCYSRDVANEYLSDGKLSAWGWGLTIVCTWSGFILLFVGIFWALNLHGKISAQWRVIRANRTAARQVGNGLASEGRGSGLMGAV